MNSHKTKLYIYIHELIGRPTYNAARRAYFFSYMPPFYTYQIYAIRRIYKHVTFQPLQFFNCMSCFNYSHIIVQLLVKLFCIEEQNRQVDEEMKKKHDDDMLNRMNEFVRIESYSCIYYYVSMSSLLLQ